MMELALSEARAALELDEVPVGCVITLQGKVIAKAHNTCETDKNCTRHAEITAINRAIEANGTKNLEGADMFVTLEPCPMCAGAIINSKIKRLYIGASEPKSGCFGSITDFNKLPFNHKVEIYYGINEDECKNLMTDFFKNKR